MDTLDVTHSDPTGVNQLFAGFEAAPDRIACAESAAALTSKVFRFMMLDEDLLAYSFTRLCVAPDSSAVVCVACG